MVLARSAIRNDMGLTQEKSKPCASQRFDRFNQQIKFTRQVNKTSTLRCETRLFRVKNCRLQLVHE